LESLSAFTARIVGHRICGVIGGGGLPEIARPALLDDFYEIGDAAVVPGFDIIGKIAGRQFAMAPVVGQAVAAYPLLGAGIGAIAHRLVLIDVTGAHYSSSIQVS
jgi:hypothetical protein